MNLRKIEANATCRENMKITTIIEEGHMRWFEQISQINKKILTIKVYLESPKKQKGKGRPRETWIDKVRVAVEKAGKN